MNQIMLNKQMLCCVSAIRCMRVFTHCTVLDYDMSPGFIRHNKRNLRLEFRAQSKHNEPPFHCPRCLAPFMSEYRLQYHEARLCSGVDPNRILPGDLHPAGTR